MRQSQLFTKTLKNVSAEETSKNAQLLTRAGFVFKNSAGVYSYLPLGWRVIEKINKIVREEINAIGGVEMFMPALVDRKYFEQTGRFDLNIGFDVFTKNSKSKSAQETEKAPYALGWTHEEVLTAICSKYINSYKDLPFALYQIQTKFRNEPRAKSGLLRGKEFLMKDLYSFHASDEDLFSYYEKVKDAYFKIFNRCGIDVFYTVASGGDFTISNTHEFQALSDVGEDEILYCSKCRYAENSEIAEIKEGDTCKTAGCEGKFARGNAIEVGNIFPLGAKYSEAFNLEYADEQGKKHFVVMGSYGIGVSRVMGAVAEISNDKDGLIWPKEIAPFQIHLIYLSSRKGEVKAEADRLYDLLQARGVDVLYDDRTDTTAGEKFAESDLFGIPVRVVVSERAISQGSVEVKERTAEKARLVGKRNIEEFLM